MNVQQNKTSPGTKQQDDGQVDEVQSVLFRELFRELSAVIYEGYLANLLIHVVLSGSKGVDEFSKQEQETGQSKAMHSSSNRPQKYEKVVEAIGKREPNRSCHGCSYPSLDLVNCGDKIRFWGAI